MSATVAFLHSENIWTDSLIYRQQRETSTFLVCEWHSICRLSFLEAKRTDMKQFWDTGMRQECENPEVNPRFE